MIKFFERTNSCDIALDSPLDIQDTEALKKIFLKNYKSYNIKFGRIYNVDTQIIKLLYFQIFEKNKNVNIVTHKYKLNRYFNQLGLKSSFETIIKDYVIYIDNIKTILIGGSADSSEKIIEIVKNTNLDNLTLIIVQHVEENKIGIFDEILQQYTDKNVSYANDGGTIQKNSIYIAPSGKHLGVKKGNFILSDEEKYNYSKPSISLSYESFSTYYKDSLLVIQECGYSFDGVDKLKYLKEQNSKLIIQDKDECEAKSMITNALVLNQHDYVLNQKNIIDYINLLDFQDNDDSLIKYMLDMIFKKYGYDFRLYHMDMIKRRLIIFMSKHEIKILKSAVCAILFNTSAFKAFFLEISINVTELFREPTSFKKIVELLDNNYKYSHSIKIWSAGCSSGEEVYSIAILLKKLEIFDKSIIYATDFNQVVLEEAKNAIFSNKSFDIAKKNFSKIDIENDLDNYVEKYKNFVIMDDNIKNKILFFQHNLVTDSSFNEFDIIICKNVVIYFNNFLQEKVFKLFYDSLKFGGYLVLGESEMIHPKFSSEFEQCSENYKIFKKVG